MTLISTTFQPWRQIDVDAAELEWLDRWRLDQFGLDLFSPPFSWTGQPPFTYTVTLTITDANSHLVVLGPTNNGLVRTSGGWTYRWLNSAQTGAGDYMATWTATDGTVTGTAATSFTITATIGSGYGTCGYGTGPYGE